MNSVIRDFFRWLLPYHWRQRIRYSRIGEWIYADKWIP